jgi:hypothetical protein
MQDSKALYFTVTITATNTPVNCTVQNTIGKQNAKSPKAFSSEAISIPENSSYTWYLDFDTTTGDAQAIITFTDCKPNQSIFADYKYSQKQTITYKLNNQSITAIGIGEGSGVNAMEPEQPIYTITVKTP